jgi:P-type Cu+ transporter
MSNSELNTKNIVFHIEGAHCVNCIRKLQAISKDFEDIKNIQVDLGSKKLTAYYKSDFDVNLFESKVKAEGFSIKQIDVEDSALMRKQSRVFLTQIGVAGFCSGNIMLFSAAEYVGAMEESWFRLFPILSGLFFLPVLFYSAKPFFQNSYLALKAKKLSIDTPIAMAILGGSLLSYIKLINGQNEIYFDSISMFVFLLLFSRYLIFKIQNKFLSPVRVEDVYSQKSVQILLNGILLSKPIQEVTIGDVVVVSKDMYVPVDGELLSEIGLVNDAFFSGEFLPKEKKKFDLIFAGSKNLFEDIHIKVTKVSSNTRLSEIVDKLNESLNLKTEITTLADKGAYYLTISVISLSVFVFIYFSFFDIQEGINRVLALLVVACPCGLAIAIPLIQSLALKKGLMNSLLIKKPSVLEKVLNLEAVLFDKTGTLTSGEIRVLNSSPRAPSALEKKIIYSLEKQSEHPVAKSLIKWLGSKELVEVSDFLEKIGTGVSARYENDLYEIQSSKDQIKASVQFYKNKVLEFTVFLDDTIALGSNDLIKYFKNKNINTYILSGDQFIFAKKMGDFLSVNPENIYAPLSPEEKSDFVKNLNLKSLYLGDGVNDSIAMSYSSVSISMESAANVAFKSSDVHILSGGLSSVKYLFELSERYMVSVKYTAALSFIYNFIFSTFAILGYINPLVAVILMPVSSLTITFLAIFLMSQKHKGSIEQFKSNSDPKSAFENLSLSSKGI